MPENRFAQHPLRILPDTVVEDLDRKCLILLERVGVRVDSEEALGLLSDYGVRCVLERQRAYPDQQAIRKAIGTVGKSYTLHGRKSGAAPLVVDGTTTHLVSGGAALKLYADGQYRDASRDDLIDMTVLHEKLDHIDILLNVVEPPIMASETLYPTMAADLFCYSSKPLLLQVGGRRDLAKIIHMAFLLAGGNDRLREQPLFMTGINAEPPLSITRDGAEVLIDAAIAGVPVSLGVYAMMGATGPLDVAGCLVQRTATILTGLVLTQAAASGSSYDFTCPSGSCDLKSGDAVTMSPQVMQLVLGSVQMGRHYGLPTHSLTATEARGPDAQAAGDRFFSLLLSVLSGASIVQHATNCMAGMELADFAQSVLDNETAGYVLAFTEKVSTDGLDASLRAIEESVSDPRYASHSFLGHPHTAALCRTGWSSSLFAAGALSHWLNGNRDCLYEEAQKAAKELLAQREQSVEPNVRKDLYRLAEEE